MNETPRARLLVYGLALLAPAVTLLLRWPFGAVLEDRVLYVTFFPAILIVAYFGGFWPGLLATVLSALAATYFLIEPLYSLQISTVHDALALGLLVLVGMLMSGLSESLHRARRRIVADERRRAEEALREAEERFGQMAENIHEIYWVMDARDNRVLYISPRYEYVWGRPRQVVFQQPGSWIESIHPDDRDRALEHLEQYRHGVFTDGEFRVVRPDGSIRWIRSRAFPIKDQHGDISRIAGLAEDITERKQTEEALRESERRFRTFVDHATDAFFLFGENGTILDVNRQACASLGYSRDELLAMTALDFNPDVTPADYEHIMRQLLAGESYALESRHRRKDRTIFPVEIRGQAFREGGRRFRVSMVRDMTERKRAEEALRESERRWRGLTEALPQLVWSAIPDGACDYFSRQWTEHTGAPEEDLLGWRWLEVLHPDDRERTRRIWLDSVAGRGPYDVEYRVRRSDGVYRWFKTRGTPLRDEAGVICQWFGSCTDITDLRLTEDALRVAKEAAEAANRAKDEFLANVSHEIRTPMNAILGMTELTLDTPLTDDQRQCLRTVKSAADNLLGIINDLLDFSKIEAGKLELEPADFSLRAALGDTLRTLAMRAHTKGLELVSYVQPDVPDALVGDAGRLRQVLLNLVGNAIKFTDRGEVIVSIRGQRTEDRGQRTEDTSPSVLLLFEVHDTGIGIPPDKQDKIFRAFEQEDTSTTRKYGGTGLGLTIAARLVTLMGGTIAVDSAPGRGSTFTFTAQFGRQPHAPAPAAARLPVLLDQLPVLVVDDNSTNRRILEEWLRIWQMEPVAVGDGVAALDTLGDAAARGRPYPLVLLDARMPDTDGLILAAQIRRRAELSATRLILLTSGDIPGDQAPLRALRIDAHLLKPVQQDELLEAIFRVMSRTSLDKETRRQGDKETASDTSPIPQPPSLPVSLSSKPLRILVAEDSEFNAQLLEQLLVRRGHRVRLAHNGREALALLGLEDRGTLSSLSSDLRPLTSDFDLLLLDVHMPELDGFQAIQAIRKWERSAGSHLPVIALTARSRKEDRERCLAAGMDDFLAKPIQAASLWVAIDRLVSARPPTDRQGPGLLDPRVLLAACGGDAAILERICRAFRAGLPDQMAPLQDALRERDTGRLREAAHKLGGMVTAFSTVAGAVASDLEDYAAQGRLEQARPLVAQLETMARELVRQVEGLSLQTLRRQVETVDDAKQIAEH
jgi:two-component system, sensor histidine kinase and response regulator